MGLLDIIKTKEKIKRPTIKSAGATLYPDKIVIDTVDRINLYGVTSPNVSILDQNVDSEQLGRTLRLHLEKSRDDLSKKTDIDKRYSEFLKATGFKNMKEQHKNALHLVVHEKDGKISIGPTINGGPSGKNRGFVNTKGQPLTVDSNVTDEELGDNIRLGWCKCVCNCA